MEVSINEKASNVDICEFTQHLENTPRINWQVPFSEKYLNMDGDMIIGDESHLPEGFYDSTRLLFYIYFLDINKTLLTPFGELELIEKIKQPKRIEKLIMFQNPE